MGYNIIPQDVTVDGFTIENVGGSVAQKQSSTSFSVTGLSATNNTVTSTISLTNLENRDVCLLWLRYFMKFINQSNYTTRTTSIDLKIELDGVVQYNERIAYSSLTNTGLAGNDLESDGTLCYPLEFTSAQKTSGADLKITITCARNWTSNQWAQFQIDEMKLLKF